MILATDNLGMWWHRRRPPAAPSAMQDALVHERAALERLIATTDNAAVAELAKIRLRVVRFLTPAGAAARLESTRADVEAFDLAKLDLPRTRSPSPAAHLVDVTTKVSALTQLQAANESRYHAIAPGDPPPIFRADDAWPLVLTAAATSGIRAATAIATGLASFVLVSALLVTWTIVAPRLPPEFLRSAQSLMLPAILTLLTVLLYLTIRRQKDFFGGNFVDANGVHLRKTLYPWDRIASIRIESFPRHLRFAFRTSDGNDASISLDMMQGYPDEWIAIFTSYMKSRPRRPNVIVNGAHLVEAAP